MKIAFTVNGNRNTKVKVKNLSIHMLLNLSSGYAQKMMLQKYDGKFRIEEARVQLTDGQFEAVLNELKHRQSRW